MFSKFTCSSFLDIISLVLKCINWKILLFKPSTYKCNKIGKGVWIIKIIIKSENDKKKNNLCYCCISVSSKMHVYSYKDEFLQVNDFHERTKTTYFYQNPLGNLSNRKTACLNQNITSKLYFLTIISFG